MAFIGVAVLFNPFQPVRLNRETWMAIDVLVAALLGISTLDRRASLGSMDERAFAAQAERERVRHLAWMEAPKGQRFRKYRAKFYTYLFIGLICGVGFSIVSGVLLVAYFAVSWLLAS